MTVKEAKEITGGLSNPSKMPGKGYSLPANKCNTGRALRACPGSVCSICYGCKGRYLFNNVEEALNKRVRSITCSEWEDAMAFLINREKVPWFRWHDSGDLQSFEHLLRIINVCEKCPGVRFRLPTKEHSLIFKYIFEKGNFPTNLTVRLSPFFINEDMSDRLRHLPVSFSMVYDKDWHAPAGAIKCPATISRKICGDCRVCWNSDNRLVAYKVH